MKRPDLPPLDAELASLLATERTVEPLPAHVEAYAVARARAALSVGSSLPAWRQPFWLRARTAVAASLAVTVAVAGAAAFQARRTAHPSPREAPLQTVPLQETQTPTSDLHPMPATDSAPFPATSHDDVAHLNPIGRTAVTPNDYALELRLLRRARAAIARGAFAEALTPLAEHARRMPSGRFVEEREALRVRSLAGLRLGARARRAADVFKARFPHSVLLPRVEEMAREASK